ncbi:hypothetical protein BDV06DRAFT_7783 [Aspergillus oleicola]
MMLDEKWRAEQNKLGWLGWLGEARVFWATTDSLRFILNYTRQLVHSDSTAIGCRSAATKHSLYIVQRIRYIRMLFHRLTWSGWLPCGK